MGYVLLECKIHIQGLPKR